MNSPKQTSIDDTYTREEVDQIVHKAEVDAFNKALVASVQHMYRFGDDNNISLLIGEAVKPLKKMMWNI